VAAWRSRTGNSSGDVAGLVLDNPVPLGASPVPLTRGGDVSGHYFQAYGYRPSGGEEMPTWVPGRIVNRTEGGWLQLGAGELTGGLRIHPGFSGTPVWDEQTGQIVGLVTAGSRGSDWLAYAVSGETIFDAWPDLRDFFQQACPFRSLTHFTAADSDLFFGRDQLAAQAAGIITRSEHTIVSGASGAGKTSLIHAKVIPELQRQGHVVIPVRPTSRHSLWTELATAIKAGANHSDLNTAELAAAFASEPQLGKVGLLCDSVGSDHVVIFIDQYDELLRGDPARARQFTWDVGELPAVRHPEGRPFVRVVIVVREEHENDLRRLPPYDTRSAPVVRVGPLDADQLRAAIEGPVQLIGFARYEETLVDRIIDEVSVQPYCLPALQVILTELWERQAPDGLLSHSVYQELNRPPGPLATHLEKKWNELPAEDRATALRLFLHLVIPIGDDAFARRAASQAEMSPEEWRIAGTLATQRLVVLRSAPDGQATAELAHHTLIDQWPALDSHLKQHRAFIEWRDDTRRRITSWDQALRQPSQLLTGRQLEQGLELLRLPGSGVSERERDYLLASKRKQEASRRRRRVSVIAALTVLITAAAATIVAVNQYNARQRQQRLALASQLITTASQLSASQPQTSLFLALEAMHLDPGPQARQTLIKTLASTHYAGMLNLHQALYGVAYSSSGNLLAITGSTVSLWETRTKPMRKIATIPGTATSLSPDGRLMAVADTAQGGTGFALWDITVPAHPVRMATLGRADAGASVSLSPAGHLLATFDNATIRIWDVTQPRHPLALASANLAGGVANEVVFSPDGKELATAGYEESITLWNVANPRHITMLSSGFGNNPFSVAFSPDGRTLAVPSDGVYELQRAGPSEGTYNLAAASAANSDRTASLWNISNPRHPRKLSTLAGHTDTVLGVAFSPDSDTLVTTSADQTAILWDVTNPSQPTRLDTLSQHTQAVNAASFSPDGTMLTTVSDDGTAILWTTHRPDDLQRIATFGQGSIASGHYISGVAFAADARTAVSYGGQYVTIWNLKNPARPQARAELTLAPNPYSGLFDGATLSPDGRLLAVLSSYAPFNSDQLTLWKITDHTQFQYLTSYDNLANYTGNGVFSHDGRFLAIPAPDYGVRLVRISDRGTATSVTYLRSSSDPFAKNDGRGYLTDISFSPNDDAIIGVSNVGPAYLWNLRSAAPTGALIELPILQNTSAPGQRGPSWAFASNAFYMRTASGVAPYVVTYDMNAISTTTLWDAADPSHLVRAATLTGLSQGIQEGGRLMATLGAQYYIWDITDPGYANLLLSMGSTAGPSSAPNSTSTRMTFSPDGNLFAISDSNSAQVVLFSTSALHDVVSDPIKTACLITGPFMPQNLLVSYGIGAADKKVC
jgi:WD40 repeat protein